MKLSSIHSRAVVLNWTQLCSHPSHIPQCLETCLVVWATVSAGALLASGGGGARDAVIHPPSTKEPPHQRMTQPKAPVVPRLSNQALGFYLRWQLPFIQRELFFSMMERMLWSRYWSSEWNPSTCFPGPWTSLNLENFHPSSLLSLWSVLCDSCWSVHPYGLAFLQRSKQKVCALTLVENVNSTSGVNHEMWSPHNLASYYFCNSSPPTTWPLAASPPCPLWACLKAFALRSHPQISAVRSLPDFFLTFSLRSVSSTLLKMTKPFPSFFCPFSPLPPAFLNTYQHQYTLCMCLFFFHPTLGCKLHKELPSWSSHPSAGWKKRGSLVHCWVSSTWNCPAWYQAGPQ